MGPYISKYMDPRVIDYVETPRLDRQPVTIVNYYYHYTRREQVTITQRTQCVL